MYFIFAKTFFCFHTHVPTFNSKWTEKFIKNNLKIMKLLLNNNASVDKMENKFTFLSPRKIWLLQHKM